MKIIATASLRAVAAVLLSCGTLYAIGDLAPSGLRDALAMPGGLIGTLGGLVGLYEIPSGPWGAMCLAGNFLIYAVLWWFVAGALVRLWGTRREQK
jgi:hypothetical protein